MEQVNSLQKRVVAGVLVISLLTGLVIHNIHKREIKPEAFSSAYGVCIDQHDESSDGMLHRSDTTYRPQMAPRLSKAWLINIMRMMYTLTFDNLPFNIKTIGKEIPCFSPVIFQY